MRSLKDRDFDEEMYLGGQSSSDEKGLLELMEM